MARSRSRQKPARTSDSSDTKKDKIIALLQQANVALREKHYEKALYTCRKALRLSPKSYLGYLTIGGVYFEMGRYADSVSAYRRAGKVRPDDPRLFDLLCRAVIKNDGFEAGAEQAILGLKKFPYDKDLLIIGTAALCACGRGQEAYEYAYAAYSAHREDTSYTNLLARVCNDMGDYERSKEYFKLCIEENGTDASAKYSLAMVLLAEKCWREGWPLYESRLKEFGGDVGEPYIIPKWNGEVGENVQILVVREQGLGDEIQFGRFLPLLRKQVGKVAFVAHTKLCELPGSLYEDIDVTTGSFTGQHENGKTWYQTHLMSLPGLLGLEEDEFATNVPYLHADPIRASAWRDKIGNGGFKIGVCWHGNDKAHFVDSRHVPLQAFAPLATVEGVSLISLQKFDGTEQLTTVSFADKIIDLGEAFDAGDQAFLDTAAVIETLDLVISSDTSVAHLAGAMGKAVWLVLPKQAEWRWQRDRDDSPWYPTMRLFRQKEYGQWDDVMAHVAEVLMRHIAASHSEGPGGAEKGSEVMTQISTEISAPVSAGELIDKITILDIKAERITDEAKLANVMNERDVLSKVRLEAVALNDEISALTDALRTVNEQLWEIEDEIRLCEAAQDFGDKFVQLARSVYVTNDERAALKKEINRLTGSRLVEEKSYADYTGTEG